MDELFLCPNCYELHDEPAEPVLGHLVRCLTCEIAAELSAPVRVRVVVPRSLPAAA